MDAQAAAFLHARSKQSGTVSVRGGAAIIASKGGPTISSSLVRPSDKNIEAALAQKEKETESQDVNDMDHKSVQFDGHLQSNYSVVTHNEEGTMSPPRGQLQARNSNVVNLNVESIQPFQYTHSHDTQSPLPMRMHQGRKAFDGTVDTNE